jgi:hypothetical protein
MVDQWFYARDANKLGPFSSAQLRELAIAGEIQPTDTVFKAGIEKGVAAAKVKNLFPAGSAPVANAPGSVATADTGDSPLASAPLHVTPAPAFIPDPPMPSELPPVEQAKTNKSAGSGVLPPRKGRATAVLGAVLVGQDGINVQYIKQCTACGYQDRSKSRMPIKQGTTRVGFFCPKCRKLRQVQIHGIF